MSGNSELSGAQDWCGFSGEIDLGNPAFQQILMFYLFECPVEFVSCRSVSFERLGWLPDTNLLTNTVKKYCQEKDVKYHSVSKLDYLMDTLCTEDLYFQLYVKKEAVVFYNNLRNQAKSLLNYIRNAFAHGSFEIQATEVGSVYILESRDPKASDEIRARIVLRENTLLDWINLVRRGPGGEIACAKN